MTLDTKGREVTLPTKIIEPEYHRTEQSYVAPIILGYEGKNTDRKTYTEKEMTDISQTMKQNNTASSSKTA